MRFTRLVLRVQKAVLDVKTKDLRDGERNLFYAHNVY